MSVNLDKNCDKDFFGKIPIKLTLGKISYVNFCKLTQITKKVDNLMQGVPPIDIKLK